MREKNILKMQKKTYSTNARKKIPHSHSKVRKFATKVALHIQQMQKNKFHKCKKHIRKMYKNRFHKCKKTYSIKNNYSFSVQYAFTDEGKVGLICPFKSERVSFLTVLLCIVARGS